MGEDGCSGDVQALAEISEDGQIVASESVEYGALVIRCVLDAGEALIEVSAEGPEQVGFEKVAAREFAAPLRLAGSYVVHASLDGVTLPGKDFLACSPLQATGIGLQNHPTDGQCLLHAVELRRCPRCEC